MPSNRYKKDIFYKEADDTLKRQLISSEFRKHIALVITGKAEAQPSGLNAQNFADIYTISLTHF